MDQDVPDVAQFPGVVVHHQDLHPFCGTGGLSTPAPLPAPSTVGRVKVNRAPRPGPSLSARMRPPWASTIPLQMARPRPVSPRPGMKADEATIAKSLQGQWREEHIFELTQALELYRFYQGKIAECDREIEAQLSRFDDLSHGEPLPGNIKRRSQGNAPRFDVRSHLYRMTGVVPRSTAWTLLRHSR